LKNRSYRAPGRLQDFVTTKEAASKKMTETAFYILTAIPPFRESMRV